MTDTAIKNNLRRIISDELSRLIPGDYILADAPYYHNIGDILIWQGFHDFCKTLPGRNLGTYDFVTFYFPKISPDVTILLTGGGNFGDLWRGFQDFRLEVIRRYPDNRIVMLPQSVCYENEKLIESDALEFSRHGDLHLCARDTYSHEFLKEHFPASNVYLVPDMAMFINEDKLRKYRSVAGERKLFLRRLDKELVEEYSEIKDIADYDVRDWPTYERQDLALKLIKRLQGVAYRSRNIKILNSFTATLTARIADVLVRRRLLGVGIDFVSPYCEVVTPRLHTMILAFLLDIPVSYIDNTSGKLSAFADSWLKDSLTVRKYDVHE